MRHPAQTHPTAMQPIVTQNLTKQYGPKIALDNLTLTCGANKIIGLVGRNGAGKTTFLKTCAGLLRPTAGDLRVWGERPFNNPKVLARLIFSGEETQFESGFALQEILEIAAVYYPAWDHALTANLLKRFGLSPKLKYKNLSLGMKTQFKVTIGLGSRAPLVMFDEPTLGMDPAVRQEFYQALIEDYSQQPRTYVLSSHLPDEIENLIEEVILLKDGAVVLHKPIEAMQDYAIELHGRVEAIDAILEQARQRRQILNEEYFGINASAVIVNQMRPQDLSALTARNIQVSKVSFQDLCIYLTRAGKEGRASGETAV